GVKGVGTHAVEHHRDPAVGELPDPLGGRLGVEQHVVRAQLTAPGRLLLGRGGGDDPVAAGDGHLDEELANTARARGDQDGVAPDRVMGVGDQIVRGQSLQEHPGGHTVVDSVRHGDEGRGGGDHVLCVGARRLAPGHPVAGDEVGRARTDGLHDAHPLASGHKREVTAVDTLAEIGVDVVDADRRGADQDLAGPGFRDVEVDRREDLGTAVGSDLDCTQAAQYRRRGGRVEPITPERRESWCRAGDRLWPMSLQILSQYAGGPRVRAAGQPVVTSSGSESAPASADATTSTDVTETGATADAGTAADAGAPADADATDEAAASEPGTAGTGSVEDMTQAGPDTATTAPATEAGPPATGAPA